jgi:Uncharacterized conserved protein
MSEKTKKIIKIAAVILIAAVFVMITVILTPKLLMLRDAQVREAMRDKFDSLGFIGMAVIFGLQVLQIVVAVLPGEPVELLVGFLYGAFGGMTLCLAGIAAGTSIVFLIAGLFGKKYAEKLNDPKYKKLAFLHDPVKRDAMFFVLFLIPGTPKDLLTYIAPITGIGFVRFVAISCIARIPSVISSTYVGANLSRGNYLFSAIIFAATALFGLVGIYVNNRIIAAQHSDNSK